ncbi:MAG: hypothetical protein CEE43_18815 [Promethearchaeota archaeon Loki_b32]|nr:MAG: hypothetical protein CEE43_18815 [Candidatus Lokiarchaeota archaeon Loki_b32]
MNEEEMNEQIAKIIREAIGNMSHSSCNNSESHCNKDSPDYEPRRIHCGTDRCKGLHNID